MAGLSDSVKAAAAELTAAGVPSRFQLFVKQAAAMPPPPPVVVPAQVEPAPAVAAAGATAGAHPLGPSLRRVEPPVAPPAAPSAPVVAAVSGSGGGGGGVDDAEVPHSSLSLSRSRSLARACVSGRS